MAFGTVDKVVARTVTTMRGPTSVYDVYVDGTKYGWGFTNPTKVGVTDGAEIEFVIEASPYGPKISEGSVSVKTSGTGAPPVKSAAPAPRSPAASSGGSRDVGFPVPVTSEKISILRQNALTNARELVAMYPSMFGAETKEQLIAAILDTARVFADYSSGRDVEEKVAKLTKKMEE